MIFFDKNENIIFEIRKHWIMFWGPLTIFIVVAFFPTFLIPIFFVDGVTIEIMALVIFFTALFYLIWWVSCFVVWTNYYLDVWVVTNHKILSVDQRGLFSRSTSVLHLDKIQDINYKVTGVVASLLNYGDLEVKTAAHIHDEGFIMKGIPNPALIQAKINEALIMHHREVQKENIETVENILESKDPVSDLINSATTSTTPSESEPV